MTVAIIEGDTIIGWMGKTAWRSFEADFPVPSVARRMEAMDEDALAG